MKISTALLIAKLAHEGQRYSNEPYINHVTRVASRVNANPKTTDADVCLALLHDVVEDTIVTFKDLEEMGYNTTDLRLLTRQPGQPYRKYIKGVATSRIATRVKLADLLENLSHHPKIPEHRARYHAAVETLRKPHSG